MRSWSRREPSLRIFIHVFSQRLSAVPSAADRQLVHFAVVRGSSRLDHQHVGFPDSPAGRIRLLALDFRAAPAQIAEQPAPRAARGGGRAGSGAVSDIVRFL